MKFNVQVQDSQKRPICPKVSSSKAPSRTPPSRFRRKKQFTGKTAPIYNGNFRSMPKDT